MRRVTPSRALRLTIAYEGTRLAGWQKQKGMLTVQGILEQAFHRILQEKVHLTGAGRTDSGVHALGQVAHLSIRSSMPLSILRRALNAVLPEDIVILSLQTAPQRFHARYSAKSKWYRYLIWNRPIRPLFERNRAMWIPAPLNLQAMRRAAGSLVGKRDFRAFHSSGRPVSSTIRHLRRLSVTKRSGIIQIDAEADGFLYHMVRRIAGLLIAVGQGKVPPDRLGSIIPPTAPAKGLCLRRVRY